MLRKLFLLYLFVHCAVLAKAQNNVVDEVIWIVGDEPILLSEVEEARISEELSGGRVDNPYCVIPEQLAIQKLFLHQADIDSIEADESYAIRMTDNRLNELLQNYGSRENVELIARKTFAQLREMFKEQARSSYRVEMVQRSLMTNVRVTPAEVRDYFKNMPEDSFPYVPTQVEVQIITAEPEVSREEIERIEAKLRDFSHRVTSGEVEFSTLAKLHSTCGSAREGGELGFSGKGQWVPEFANVAFSLNDPKKVSKIVRTEFGFHILQLIAKRGDKVNVRHILLKPEIEASEYQKELLRLDSIVMDIHAEKFTFDEAAMALSEDKDTRNNRGMMFYVDPQTDSRSSRIQMSQLPPEVAKVVDTLEVGQISKSFIMTDSKGRDVCAVVKLKKRIDAHRANVTEDFQLLKDIVVSKRREKKIEQWIIDKQKSTYVRIHPDWRSCTFKYPNWVK